MLGFIGTLLVVAQMAMLSNGIDSQSVMLAGLIASMVWMCHAVKVKDKWILLTNVAVGSFAIWGLL